MRNRLPNPSPLTHLLAAAILASTASLQAQTIPPTTPTAAPAPPAAPVTPPPPATHRAKVDYTNHLITVTADNSSLNQILRDISQLTGMTITGGVTDEHVFGTYGPADPSTIFSALLNGTGSNMLLILDAAKAPHQLILTPRQGGASPPSPSTYRDDRDDTNGISPQGNLRFGKQPAQQLQPPQPSQPPPPTGITMPPAPTTDPSASSATTTQQSPNGVKTPQQIYEELVKMQQQKTTAPPPPE